MLEARLMGPPEARAAILLPLAAVTARRAKVAWRPWMSRLAVSSGPCITNPSVKDQPKANDDHSNPKMSRGPTAGGGAPIGSDPTAVAM